MCDPSSDYKHCDDNECESHDEQRYDHLVESVYSHDELSQFFHCVPFDGSN